MLFANEMIERYLVVSGRRSLIESLLANLSLTRVLGCLVSFVCNLISECLVICMVCAVFAILYFSYPYILIVSFLYFTAMEGRTFLPILYYLDWLFG